MKERKVSVAINDDAPEDLEVDGTKLTAGETVELTERQADVLVSMGHAKRAEAKAAAAPAAATKTVAKKRSAKK